MTNGWDDMSKGPCCNWWGRTLKYGLTFAWKRNLRLAHDPSMPGEVILRAVKETA